MKHFKKTLEAPATMEKTLEQASDFKKQYGLGLQPAGWYMEGHVSPILPPSRKQIVPRAT